MDTFTASNGREVSRNDLGHLVVDQISSGESYTFSPGQTLAIREFFQHERDQELGRWRWPENPDYVVYPSALYLTPSDDDLVTVVNERTGQVSRRHRDDAGKHGHFSLAASAYFADHPEPKPWHDAEDGEVWALTGAGGLEQPWRRVNGKWLSFTHGEILYGAEHAIDGRRIWPEVSDA